MMIIGQYVQQHIKRMALESREHKLETVEMSKFLAIEQTSVAILLYLCVCDFICGVFGVLICFSSLFPFVPREGCAVAFLVYLCLYLFVSRTTVYPRYLKLAYLE